MADDALETYLNDHLAGSVSAIQMLERAVDDHAGTPLGPQLADHPIAVPRNTLHPGRNEVTFSGPPRRRGEDSGIAYESIELEGYVLRGAPRVDGDSIVLSAPATLRYVLRVPPGARLAFGADTLDGLTAAVEREDATAEPVVRHGVPPTPETASTAPAVRLTHEQVSSIIGRSTLR